MLSCQAGRLPSDLPVDCLIAQTVLDVANGPNADVVPDTKALEAYQPTSPGVALSVHVALPAAGALDKLSKFWE